MGSVRCVLVVAVATLAGCTRSDADGIATSGSAPVTTTPSSTAAVTTAPTPILTSTTADASTAPAAVTTSAVASTAPTEAIVSSTSPAGDPTIVYAGSGGYAMIPLGWWDGGWHAAGFAAGDEPLPDARPTTVSIVSTLADAPLTGIAAPPSAYQCVEGPEVDSIDPVLDLPVDPAFAHSAIAVAASWDLQPRPVRPVGLDSPDYQLAGEAIVPTETGADPAAGDVTQIFRADLDGDGIEEVLFVFERQTEPLGMGAPGDFSYVVARLPSASGAVVDQVLYSHVTPQAMEFPLPDRARVAAIGDLNGDGTMEVVIDITFWEGSGAEVFELRDGELLPVLDAACGV